jgi:hypothetical protein
MKAIRIRRQPLAGDGSKSGKSDHFRKGYTTRLCVLSATFPPSTGLLKVAKFGKIASRLQPTAPPGAPAHCRLRADIHLARGKLAIGHFVPNRSLLDAAREAV